jgi:glucose-1-phosphate cytidylyltransferase
MATNNEIRLNNHGEPWMVTLIDTGLDNMTGSRIKQVKEFVGNEPFMLTYGDGVADIDINALIDFHKKHGKAITMTAAQPAGRFGSLCIDKNDRVVSFHEKPKGDGNWINAGFFVCQPKVFDYIQDGDQTVFEREPLQNLALAGELYTYKNNGFWQPMDTMRDKDELEGLISAGKASWIKW